MGRGEFYHFQTVCLHHRLLDKEQLRHFISADWRCVVIGNICFFDGRHLTFLGTHDTTFKQGIKPLISVNSTPSGQFWRPFWYEWAFSNARQCLQFPIALMINGPVCWTWWRLLWIIAFHVLGVVGVSGFLITRLPDYPNCHNCIAMGRLLHAGLINQINISGRGRQTGKLFWKETFCQFTVSLRLLRWRPVRKANSNHSPVTLSLPPQHSTL